jgi:leucyl-tRNA synthetase
VADYVLVSYGSGAIMAVPAHDERDWEFAKKYNLKIKEVVVGGNVTEEAYISDGKLINSDFLDGLEVIEAKEKMIEWLEQKKMGKREVNFKLRDWVFSRQRYWGEPIPLVHCDACGWLPLPETDLPLKLPEVEKYEPTDSGESPLATMEDWVNTTCPGCGASAKRETDTMPNWAGSSWYFLRYTDPNNDKAFASEDKLKYWMPVDWYNGGMEHVVLHLLYSRFWNQFLFDIGVVPTSEPYTKRTSHGMILAKGGEKMSKSRGNVVNPDEMVEIYGADALRSYIMFMGPFDQAVEWDTNGLVGVRRFLDRVWALQEKIADNVEDKEVTKITHQTIKKVTENIESMRFNTALSKMMELVNEMTKKEKVNKTEYKSLIQLLSPFAPHICEEIWELLGESGGVAFSNWPEYEEELAKEDTIELVVQVNGKVRATITVNSEISEEDAKKLALEQDNVIKWLEGREPKKVIFVKGKLVSIVL